MKLYILSLKYIYLYMTRCHTVDTGLIIKNEQKSLKSFKEEIYMNLLEFSDCLTSYCLDKLKML